MKKGAVKNIALAQITSDLEAFGLKSKEVKLYLALLEAGPSSIQDIVRLTGFKRTSVYMYIESLKEKGFVHQMSVKKRKRYISVPAEEIRTLFELKRAELNHLGDHLGDLISNIQMAAPQGEGAGPHRVSYYEGEQGLKKVYEDTLEEGKDILTFTAWDSMIKALPNYLPDYVKRRAKKGIRSSCIAIATDLAKQLAKKDKKQKRVTKLLQSDEPLAVETIIYGEKIALLHFKEQYLGIIIESAEFAAAQRMLFQTLWKTL